MTDFSKKGSQLHPYRFFHIGVCFLLQMHLVTAQDLSNLFKKHIDALGGSDKIQVITTVTMKGQALNVWNNVTEQAIVYKQVPFFSRYEGIIGTDTTFSLFDGQRSCIGSKPERPSIRRLAQLQKGNSKTIKPSESPISDLLLFEGYPGQVTVVPTDTNTLYELTFEDSIQRDIFYLDSKQYFIQKHILFYKESGTTFSRIFQDYRAIDGVFLPTKIISWTESNQFQFARKVVEYTSITLNKPLAPDLFRCP